VYQAPLIVPEINAGNHNSASTNGAMARTRFDNARCMEIGKRNGNNSPGC